MRTSILTVALLGLLMTGCNTANESARLHENFNENWKFILDDSESYAAIDLNDSKWRNLTLPHDWSIEGEFSDKHPAGIGGGALPGGIGWYRKVFTLPESDASKKVYITFDGIYQNSSVYINGQLLGTRPNGYITFQYDLSPYLNYGNERNVIAVRVDNGDQPNSRWYSGSGIYRNVWLTRTNPVHISNWGVYIETPKVNNEKAEMEVEITISNTTSADQSILVETQVLDQNGILVSNKSSEYLIAAEQENIISQHLQVKNPQLWNIERPYLYKIVNILKQEGNVIDEYMTSTGLRSFEFDSEKGFILNDEQVKILGVCNHHDLGALGAAVNTRAIERQLEILKEMGCNGIRTSHNPPSTELLDLCDRMGFIVMNETFDVWKKSKVKNDYSIYFDEWHKKDLIDHLKRDRNHPCIFSWSIGNEILEQWDTSGISIAKELAGICRKYIPNIPITGGFNDPEPHNNIIMSGEMDLIGFNYKHGRFEAFPETFPGQKFIATETTSSLNSRGEYDMPSDSVRKWPVRWDIVFYDGMEGNRCSSYDNCRAPWGSTHAESWREIKKHDYLSGMYIWTGFDYLGEPTPYQWPSRSSYFGIIDLAGFPKDAYYMYQSEWTDKNVLHLFPHWNWSEGQTVDVWAYTNFDEVELFLNNESLGTKSKENDMFHIMWRTEFQEGQLKAVGRKKDGTEKTVVINTAGEAYQLELLPDRKKISADGKDLCFVTINVRDENGNLVPHADNMISFETSDNVIIAGVDNGDQTSHEPFHANYRKAYNGKCLVILMSGKEEGFATLKASADGLVDVEIEVELVKEVE